METYNQQVYLFLKKEIELSINYLIQSFFNKNLPMIRFVKE